MHCLAYKARNSQKVIRVTTALALKSAEMPSRLPLYGQVRQRIVAAIEQGEWDAGEALPSEAELGDRYGVSQGTVRKALDSLVAEGMLVRRQGLGTFVALADDDWGSAASADGLAPLAASLELLSCARSHASDEVATALGLRRAAPLMTVRRLVRVDGEPFALIESSVSAERFEGLDARRIRLAGCNLRSVWWREFGLRLVSGSPQFRAVRAVREVARLLMVDVDSPLLEVTRACGGLGGEAVEWSVLLCRTDRFVYRV